MTLLESVNIASTTQMPGFELPDTQGNMWNFANLTGSKGLLVVFTCNHCPYAIAVWERIIALSIWAKTQGINSVAINSNIHPSYPEDSPEEMINKIKEWKIPFPYLIDSTQEVARQYQAQCTPDIYLVKKDQTLFYHGRLDDSWKEPQKVTKEELKIAIECLTLNKAFSEKQNPSMGCSIKWK